MGVGTCHFNPNVLSSEPQKDFVWGRSVVGSLMGLAGLVVGLLRFKYGSDMLDPKYKGLDIFIFFD